MSGEAPKNERHKCKRKKSFLKNARKYAKKGCYGRGSQLEPDTYQYFVRIMEAYREGFDSDEDKSMFVNNVFEQTVENELNCCCNQVGCRVIEQLLPFANGTVLVRFMEKFGNELRPLCSDRFSSHVLETLVILAANNAIQPQIGGEYREQCEEFALKVSKFLLNNLEDYIWDTYGSHVIRSCLESLAQIPRENKLKEQPKVASGELPEKFIEVVRDYGERLIVWPQFAELLNTEVTSAFLQVLLKALHKIDKKLLKKYLNKLTSESFTRGEDDDTKDLLPTIFLSKSAMMVLEAALEVGSSKNYTQIYLNCFAGKLSKLATTRSTNFAVQKLVSNCKDKSEFELIFDELADTFGDIIESGHTGIIWALGQGCKNLTCKQGPFVQNLMKALHCFEPEERQNQFVLCLCKFANFETIQIGNLAKEKLNLHGTLLLQLLLEFNKPIKIVNSILNMEQNVVMGLFSNTMGSHIVDSFVKSTFVGEKSREKLTRKMKGCYQELAATKYGSRSFEALYNAANLKTKLAIMEELVYKDAAWCNSEFGKIIACKINLALYKRNKDDWKNSLNNANKAQALFADILK